VLRTGLELVDPDYPEVLERPQVHLRHVFQDHVWRVTAGARASQDKLGYSKVHQMQGDTELR